MFDPFGGHQLAIPFQSIKEVLKAYRERDPDKRAIVDLDQETNITFGELDGVVTDIAADLKQRGIGKGDVVLLLAHESLEKLLLWFGIWRIGAVVCPLTVSMHEAHLKFIATLVKPKLVLIHEELNLATQLGLKAPICTFGRWRSDPRDARDDYFRGLARGAAADGLGQNSATDLASMICTSGTTGRPKVIVYDHSAYWLIGLDTIDMLGLTAEDRTLEYRSFGWNSAQILSLMPFLQLGPTIHVARRFSNSRFFDWIRDNRITFAAGVPTVINILLNRSEDEIPEFPTLRLMTSSSAAISQEQWERFEMMYRVPVLQFYGMSEAGWVCGNPHYGRRMGTVGKPALHQEFDIVDAEGNSCPPNVEGEVTVGGPQVAIGLLQDDGTIAPIRGQRFRSGDLAIRDEDGFVRVTGRTKDIIKRGGMAISPTEIDAVLMAHPALLDAASIGVPDAIHGEEVVAFGVPRPGAKYDGMAILRDCAEKLPLPKRPKGIFFISELPRSDRGKILRDKLREEWSRRISAPA